MLSATLPAPTSTAPVNIPEPVGRALKAAINFTQSGHTAKALEALAAAAVTDIQQFNQAFLASAFEAAFMADLYDQALAKFAGGGPRARPPHTPGPATVAYVLPSIVQGQAAAQTVVRLAELHDANRVKVHVIVCEEHTARTPPLSMLHSPDTPSEVVGVELMARLRAAGAGVHVVPTTGDLLSGARAAIAKAQSLCLAGAAFIASPACPIQAVMLAARIAPVQVNLNIGVPMLCRGVDGVVYHNPARAAADGAVLAARGTVLHSLACTGTDTAAAENAPVMGREAAGVPEGATLLVSAANKLPERMLAGSFCTDLCAFLKQQPRTHWVGIGRGDFSGVRGACERAGVGAQVTIVGAVRDVRPYFKMADVTLNEYPEGGYTTVMESMACGTPVVALAAGARHAESAGAQLVGGALARTTQEYWARVTALCLDGAARREAGAAQRARAVEHFSLEAIARAYERILTSAEPVAGTAR